MTLTPLLSASGRQSSPEETYAELLRVIRRVRWRWRLRRLLAGAAVTVGAALLLLFVSAAAVDALRYPPWLVRSLGTAAWILSALAVWRFVWRPLRFRRSDRQVALYVEEHDPGLREAVLSGVELGGNANANAGASPELTRLVVEEAVRRLEGLGAGATIETRGLRRAAGTVALVFAFSFLVTLLAPPALTRGAALLLTPWADLDGTNPYRVLVEPGDAAIPRGADQWVRAQPSGFSAEAALLGARVAGETRWESVLLEPDAADGAFRHLLLGVSEATDYFVEMDGVRSPTFRIEVEDAPYAAQIALRYRYPSHTGLSPNTVTDGGDLAAVAGTEVEIFVRPSVRAEAGEIRFGDGSEPIPLFPVPAGMPGDDRGGGPGAAGVPAASATPEVLGGSLHLERSGSYRIALADGAGVLRTASRDYAIEVLDDLPPIVRILRPARDTRASPVEEVFTEVRAEDDYRVARLELRTAVNGGPETAIPLAGDASGNATQAGHTLFLEEWDLQPGDLVSYYAVAADGSGRETASDLFFVAIRPFDRTYRQADSRPGGGGGGGDGLDGSLTLRQRQVVLATFRVLRDDSGDGKRIAEEVATIGLAQGRLREQVTTLVLRLRNRGIAESAEFGQIVGHLDQGLLEMSAAEELLIAGEPGTALPREQKALTHLQRADAVFREVQVAFGQGGGGGGGAPPPEAEDLAHLFELEMDRLRNQYETVEQQSRSTADEEVDEVMERLAELARRQEQENERQRRGLSAPGAGPGSAQGRIAAETEEAARRLERLARERSLPELAQVARRLRSAARQMRDSGSGGEGLEPGLAAENELRNARRDLDGERRGRLGRDLSAAAAEAQRLRAKQDRIRSSVADLGERRSEDRIADLHREKQELAERVESLERRLDAVGRAWGRDEPEAAGAAAEAAEGIRARKVKEKIHYSRGVAVQRSPEYADRFEEMISGDLETLAEDIEAARSAADGSRRAGEDRVLERAGSLVRGLEAMRDRLARRSGTEADRAARPPIAGEVGEEAAGAAGEGAERGGAPGGERGRRSGEDLRQLERELRQRVADAEALQREMTGIGRSPDAAEGRVAPERLDPALAALRGLSAARLSADPRGMELLESEVLDSLRQIEFELRRSRFGGGETSVATLGGERIPEAYREMVEEYFRALSRTR